MVASSLALALETEKLPEGGLVRGAGLRRHPGLFGRLVWFLEHVEEVLVRPGNLGPGQRDHLWLGLGLRLLSGMVGVDGIVAQHLGVFDEGLSQVAADLLPYGLLHGQVALQVPEVALRERLRWRSDAARGAGRLMLVSLLVLVLPHGRRGRGLLAPGSWGVVVGPQVAEHVPDVGDAPLHGHLLIGSPHRRCLQRNKHTSGIPEIAVPDYTRSTAHNI